MCHEPHNVNVIRNVRLMEYTRENFETFFEKAKKYRTLLHKEIGEDREKFLQLFIRQGAAGIEPTGVFYVIDDFVGVYYATKIIKGEDASVHYTFLDGRHKGREDLTREMIKYLFKIADLNRITADMPAYLPEACFKFVERVGFTREGRKRQAVLYKGAWFDIKIYGILKEELWDIKYPKLEAEKQLPLVKV